MPENEQQFYDRVIRRIGRLILILGLAGAAILSAVQGPRMGLSFLVGAAVSYLSFWRWQVLVGALGPAPKKRSPWIFVLRIVLLVALAYVIIRFLGLNIAAAVTGLLVSGIAVILELIYEMIYART